MQDSIRHKLENLSARHEEIGRLLGQPEIITDQPRFRELAREYAQLEPSTKTFAQYRQAEDNLQTVHEMTTDQDAGMRQMAEEELGAAQAAIAAIETQLQKLLLPKDPHDDNNVFLEIRAGTGGDEAAIFVGDLLRMYSRYAEALGWKIERLSEREGEHGGYKEVIARLIGQGAYSRLKFESGAHRVQRVPETESQGRIHTSAATVAILPEAKSAETIDINPADLRIDTYRSSGAGGQHVNKTDSAIRITHLPSGMVVECQDERSQHKNRARALSLLQARLLDAETSRQRAAQAESRRLQVGSGDRSERIRTYNYPQGRVTDHRINLTLYKIEEIMAGGLAQIIDPLLLEHQADLLAELND